jgi:hypothetical protein
VGNYPFISLLLGGFPGGRLFTILRLKLRYKIPVRSISWLKKKWVYGLTTAKQ